MADDNPADAPEAVAAEGADSSDGAEGDQDQAPIDPKQPIMAVKVYAPFQVYFEGKAVSLTAANETGPFDILPHHRNFLCMLVPCDLIVRTPYEEKTIKIARALLHVRKDKVTVFVDV